VQRTGDALPELVERIRRDGTIGRDEMEKIREFIGQTGLQS